MAVGLRFFVIVTKLDEYIITGFNLVKHFLPSSFINKPLGRTTVDGMVVYYYTVLEIFLKDHSPASFLFTVGGIFIGHGRIADRKDGDRKSTRLNSSHQ